MTVFHSLRGESRVIDKMALWGQDALPTDPTHAGVPVNSDTALRLSAVWRCINLRASTIAALPADVFRYVKDDRIEVDPPPDWLNKPNAEMTWFEFMEFVTACLDIDGNAFLAITARYPGGDRVAYPRELWPLQPQQVRVYREGREIRFEYMPTQQTYSRYSLENPGGQVLHIKAFSNGGLRGLSPIEQARQGIALGLVTEKHGARFFGSGQQMSGLIKMAGAPLKQVEGFIETIKKTWVASYGGSDRSHLPGVLVGAEWVPLTIPNDQAQFLETRKFQVRDIARFFGMPPHKIMDLEQATFSNIEHQAIEFVTDAILPTVRRLEAAFNQLTPRGQYIRWSLNGLLRGDVKSRYDAYATLFDRGIIVGNEIRHWEELNALDGLDEPVRLATLAPISEIPTEPPDEPSLANGNGQVKTPQLTGGA